MWCFSPFFSLSLSLFFCLCLLCFVFSKPRHEEGEWWCQQCSRKSALPKHPPINSPFILYNIFLLLLLRVPFSTTTRRKKALESARNSVQLLHAILRVSSLTKRQNTLLKGISQQNSFFPSLFKSNNSIFLYVFFPTKISVNNLSFFLLPLPPFHSHKNV